LHTVSVMAAVSATLFRLARNVLKYRLLTDTSIRSDHFGRAHMADLAARFVKNNRVTGSYLEFGVWRGSTFAQFYHTFRRHRLQLPMYAFDSFQGLPEPGGADTLPGYEPFQAGQFGCSVTDFMSELRGRWVPESAYTVVAGFYEDTLRPELYDKVNLDRAALVWIDCVLYESARAALEFIRPLLQDGTLIMFNDFYRFKGHPELGERRAFTEFRANNPDVFVTDYAKFSSVGQTFLIHTL
jgi:O-methyltransferase